jgi:hypothetical protein
MATIGTAVHDLYDRVAKIARGAFDRRSNRALNEIRVSVSDMRRQ